MKTTAWLLYIRPSEISYEFISSSRLAGSCEESFDRDEGFKEFYSGISIFDEILDGELSVPS